MAKLTFPVARPDDEASASTLWMMQNTLLKNAEELFGPRDGSKKIFQPIFNEKGPYLINTPDLGGAFCALSLNGAGYWPTALYEMAHETVHLLDPIAGVTTWLEEGAAVAFSVKMSLALTSHPMKPEPSSAYFEAYSLVQRLSSSFFDSLKRVRHLAGKFSLVNITHMNDLFPFVPENVCEKLVSKCIPRERP